MGWKGCDGLFALDETDLDCHATTSPLHLVFAGIDGFAFNLDLLRQMKFPLIAFSRERARRKHKRSTDQHDCDFRRFHIQLLYVESKSNRQQYDLRLVERFREVTKKES